MRFIRELLEKGAGGKKKDAGSRMSTNVFFSFE
jgi:hypothetical protein